MPKKSLMSTLTHCEVTVITLSLWFWYIKHLIIFSTFLLTYIRESSLITYSLLAFKHFRSDVFPEPDDPINAFNALLRNSPEMPFNTILALLVLNVGTLTVRSVHAIAVSFISHIFRWIRYLFYINIFTTLMYR